MTYKLFLFCFILLFMVQPGHGQKKNKDYQVTIYLSKFLQGTPGKYLSNYSAEEYSRVFQDAFLEKLENKKVKIVYEFDSTTIGTEQHFIVSVDNLRAEERRESTTVLEMGNSRTMEYLNCMVSADIRITKLEDGRLIKIASAQAEKSEEIHNRRNLVESTLKIPKEEIPYRVKDLKSDVILRLSQRCGKKTAGKATRIISRELKKRKKKR